MIRFDDDGSLSIDFDESGPIRVRPPKFGAMKRLRAERDRLAIEGGRAVAALGPTPTAASMLEEQHPEEPADGAQPADIPEQSEEERRDAAFELLVRQTEHQRAVENINLDVSVQWWRLVLIGDDTFAGLASPAPPADPDEWPAALLFDLAPIPLGDDGKPDYVAAALRPRLTDRIFQHWGKVR